MKRTKRAPARWISRICIIAAAVLLLWLALCISLYFFEAPGGVTYYGADREYPFYDAYSDFDASLDGDIYIRPVNADDVVPDGQTDLYYVRDTVLIVTDDETVPERFGLAVTGRVKAMSLIEAESHGMSYTQLLELCDRLEKDPSVRAAMPDYFEITPDEAEDASPALPDKDGKAYFELIGVDDRNALARKCGPCRVGMIDDFVTPSDEYELGYTFGGVSDTYYSMYSHGTRVASVIAGKEHGILPGAQLYTYCGINNDMAFWLASLCRMITEDGCRVVNISMGYNTGIVIGGHIGNPAALSFAEDENAFCGECLAALAEKGHEFLLVVASGNESDDVYYRDSAAPFGAGEKTVLEKLDVLKLFDCVNERIDGSLGLFFADMPNSTAADRVITVGSCDAGGTAYSDFSNTGDISVCGEHIDCYDPGYGTVPCAGTSFAAPQVAGLAAAVFALRPDMTGSEVKELLISSARETGPEGLKTADFAAAGLLQ